VNPTARLDDALRARSPDFITLADVDALMAEHGDLRDGDRWGRWTYDASVNVLSIPAYGPTTLPYEVDLDRCGSELDAWGWAAHIGRKVWATDADVGALLRALSYWLDERAGQ
jgi:hypothetical protein